jgi:hypothetical protein
MTEIVIALLLWGVVIAEAVSRARDSDRSILISSAAIALSLTFNIDAIYLAGDMMLGGANWLELISDLALLVGISFLLRGLLRATRKINGPRIEHWQTGMLIVVAILVSVLFVLIDAPASSTTFMLDFGDQPAAAAYSITQFASVGTATLIMAWMSFRHLGEMPQRVSRASLLLVCAGCVCGLLLSALIISMDLAHVTGGLATMEALSVAYDPLYVAAIAFLCIGNAIPPTVRRANTHRDRVETNALLRQMAPVWEEVVDADAAISVSQYYRAAGHDGSEDKERVLHRMIVEIRDATSGRKATLRPAADALVRRAENHLLSPRRAGKSQ